MDNQSSQGSNADNSEGIVDISMNRSSPFSKSTLLMVAGLVLSIVVGLGLGYVVATSKVGGAAKLGGVVNKSSSSSGDKAPQVSLKPEDVRDSATGVIKIKPEKDKKVQGSHILQREDSPWPVYIISNLVDLSKYEGKNVTVSGFTFGCGPSIWCLEVNKVEEK